MGYTTLPDQLLPMAMAKNKVTFLPYASHTPVIKGRSSLKQHLISLITEGEKIIHVGNKAIHVSSSNILLLAAGNYLYTERFTQYEQLKSTMVFFDDDLLQNALGQLKPAKALNPDQARHNNGLSIAKHPFVLFPKDDYLHNFIHSIQSLIASDLFTAPLQLIKLNELLIFLGSKYPESLAQFQHESHQRPDEERIKQVMEDNVSQDLSISELAFLCHMSLPTFKRKFQQIYNQSPARWGQGRRLAIAADLLRRRVAKPGDVYLEAGYENHSSFSKAFKLHFGVLPKDY